MRFGLIGLGGIGSVRRAALEKSPDAELTVACDLNRKLTAQLPSSVRAFEDAEELVRSDLCDAVIVSTPPHSHEGLTLAALENGKHVIVEKPMASSLDACKRMLMTARRVGKILTVGFNHRYFQAVAAVRETIQSGAIGEVAYIKGYAGHTGLSEFESDWMYDKDVMGGGTLVDNGIHVLDLVCHLMGGVSAVSGMITTDIWDLDRTEDNAFVHLIGDSGIVGSLHSSWSEWKGYHFHVEVYGDRGMARAAYAPMRSTVITLDRPGGRPETRRNFYVPSILREKFFGWQSTVIRTFVEELRDFVSLCYGGPPGNIARAMAGYRSIEIANAVYRSSREHCFVDLEKNP